MKTTRDLPERSYQVSRRQFVFRGVSIMGASSLAPVTVLAQSGGKQAVSLKDNTLRISDPNGMNVSLENLKLDPKERAVLDKLLASQDLDKLTPEERKLLTTKKSLIGEGSQALIVRFDLKIIRIDEKLPASLLRSKSK